jgi:integrase/recombinase XerD
MSGGDSLTLLAEWIEVLRARDLSPRTIHLYELGMFKLLAFHSFRVHPLDMTEGLLAAFLASVGDHSAMKSQYARALMSFYKVMTRRGYLLTNPLSEEITPRPPQSPPAERFEPDDITRLLIAAAYRDERRAWALLACLCLGARRAEMVGLRVDAINWSRMTVRLFGKGRKYRDVDISAWAAEALRELMRWSDGERVLPIRPATMNEWMRQAAEDCGFPEGKLRKVHTLRSTYASWMADSGAPIQVIQALMGHSSAKTTSGYLAIGRRDDKRSAVAVFGGRV